MTRFLCLLVVLSPAAFAQHAPSVHVLPFPTAERLQHAIELTVGEAEGAREAVGVFSVQVAEAPDWLAFTSPVFAATSDTESESVARIAFTVAPSAPVGETASVALVVVDAVGAERARHTVRVEVAAPDLALAAPWPNPSRGGATVAFTLAESGPVRLAVIDMLGREVAVLADGDLAAGGHEQHLRAGALAAGTYLVRLSTDTDARLRRLTVVR